MRTRPSLIGPLVTLLLLVAVGNAAGSREALARVTWFDQPDQEAGAEIPAAFVVQQRGYYSITAHMHLKALTPGHLYTLWWVTYDTPGACSEGCDLRDLASVLVSGTNPAGIAVQFGGTFVAGTTGKVDVSTRVLENAVSGCPTVPPFASVCTPYIDASVAQATILINDHGSAGEASPLAAQAFSHGCKSYDQSGTTLVTYAETGFHCYTAQSAFLP